ncbi:hypothetical protein PPSIR1_21059 [Plesiocystis pacifica SIR-1]|uniref:Uncharacterized protein n=1 Tax=Plesiocystis pacifica SIR-1 TaxID=391625 RepID=A6G3F1_9BACT|nr:hypothetical protein [Plesiocystis pacifica]EDM79558.1 hypothetical protein PPSIR1_21059 [Plesiocystis pacifica SIR-1]
MLLRPDATYLNHANRHLPIFPPGTDWLHFESKLPGKEVFADSILDPAVGLSGELGLRTFASADWKNWISTSQISLFEIGTRIGVPAIQGAPLGRTVAQVYSSVGSVIDIFQHVDDGTELVTELLKNAGMQALQQIAGQTNMIGQTVAQVIAAAVWAADVVAAHRASELAKDVALPPLQSEEPATDTWQVNRVMEVIRQRGHGGVVFPDGKVEAASNADYTSLYLPAYEPRVAWKFQHRANGIAAQQGDPGRARGPRGETQYRFDVGDGANFGFMPGTRTMLRVLQASYRFYQTPRGTPVDRYSLRCKGVDKPCYMRAQSFDGRRDCRMCVKAESVWPTQGLGWAYAGAPLNVTTPGENVGAFYPSTNKLLAGLLESIAQPGPLLYTIDVEAIDFAWQRCFERFWEFVQSEWTRVRAPGWRGLLSRLATLMTAFEDGGELRVGGRDPRMPTALIANPREGRFSVPFSESIYARLIKPFCKTVAAMQLRGLDTLDVAYIPPGAGALYREGGQVRRNRLGDAFTQARSALLQSNKRMLVDLREVADPELRKELEASGVKVSTVNPLLQGSPGLGHEILRPSIKPPRAIKPPRIASGAPLDAAVSLGRLKPPQQHAGTVANTSSEAQSSQLAAGLTAGGALTLTVAGLWGLHRLEGKRRDS